jgi:hypothetical protein
MLTDRPADDVEADPLPADRAELTEDEDDIDDPGGRHTVSPGRIMRSSDTAFVDSSADIEIPARREMPHHVSPDSTMYVGAFEGEHDDDRVAPAGRHTTLPGWMTSSAEASLARSNERIDTFTLWAMSNHVSPAATR